LHSVRSPKRGEKPSSRASAIAKCCWKLSSPRKRASVLLIYLLLASRGGREMPAPRGCLRPTDAAGVLCPGSILRLRLAPRCGRESFSAGELRNLTPYPGGYRQSKRGLSIARHVAKRGSTQRNQKPMVGQFISVSVFFAVLLLKREASSQPRRTLDIAEPPGFRHQSAASTILGFTLR